MKVQAHIIALAYVVGAILVFVSTLYLFQAGYEWGRYENVRYIFRPLTVGLALLLVGLSWVAYLVRCAYLGQEIAVKDLPKRRYHLVGRNMHNLILEEDKGQRLPFGPRRYCVYSKEEIRYERTYVPRGGKLVECDADDIII